MASHLNIGTNQDDVWFRYKMPAPILEHQKKNTIFTNFKQVTEALVVDPLWLIQYFSYRFGLLVTYDKKSGRATLNGTPSEADLLKCLVEFIKQFVLCPKCKLPEIRWRAKPKLSQIKIRCEACGHNTVLLAQKNQRIFDKMVNYICSEAEAAEASVKVVANKVANKVTEEVTEEELPTSSLKGWSDGSDD